MSVSEPTPDPVAPSLDSTWDVSTPVAPDPAPEAPIEPTLVETPSEPAPVVGPGVEVAPVVEPEPTPVAPEPVVEPTPADLAPYGTPAGDPEPVVEPPAEPKPVQTPVEAPAAPDEGTAQSVEYPEPDELRGSVVPDERVEYSRGVVTHPEPDDMSDVYDRAGPKTVTCPVCAYEFDPGAPKA